VLVLRHVYRSVDSHGRVSLPSDLVSSVLLLG
jgi:hypothetical protein